MKKYVTPIIVSVLLETTNVVLASNDTNYGFWTWEEEGE